MFRKAALLAALLSLPALGASPLDAVRGQAAKARASVNAVRADQMARRAELNQLSARIEILKGESKGKGALLAGGELDGALKASQELSNQLTGLSQALVAREGELEAANLALLEALSRELGQLRDEFDRQGERQARLAIIKRLREARAEREQVRAMLPAAKVPAVLSTRPSDDPEALLEQVDLMRDREDQVRKELKRVEQRIAERQDERDLDRRVNQFLGDESFFDDADRRLRVRRETPVPSEAKTQTAAGPASAETGGAENKTPTTRSEVGVPYESANDLFGGAATGAPAAFGAAPAADTGNGRTTPSPPPSDGVTGGGATDPSAQPKVKVQTGSDARPTVGGGKRIAGGEDEDLEDLEIQRAKLKGLAEELKLKAKQLEKKAAELR